MFIGKIPRDCYEDELFPVLARAGRVHELRLMMLFSGTNRGYAFVMYERPEEAKRAVDMLDGYEIRRGHRIGVLPCLNNCRLFIGCFGPGDRSPDELEQVGLLFRKFGPETVCSRPYSDKLALRTLKM